MQQKKLPRLEQPFCYISSGKLFDFADWYECFSFESCTANQAAVNIRLSKKFFSVRSFHRTAVLDDNFISYFLVVKLCNCDDDLRGEILSTLYRLGSEPLCLSQYNEEKSSKMSVSPGELRKLIIAMGISSPISFMILDEPTNHMDITSVMALEQALQQVDCGLLIVSHDKIFLEKVCQKNWHITREKKSWAVDARILRPPKSLCRIWRPAFEYLLRFLAKDQNF